MNLLGICGTGFKSSRQESTAKEGPKMVSVRTSSYSRNKAGRPPRSYRRPRRSSFQRQPSRSTSPYVDRNESLKQLGFASYDEYLKSELWHKIRVKVLLSDQLRCFGCNERATQVHHRRYDLPVLKGERITTDDVVSICRECHNHIEINPTNGQKFPLHTANKRLKKLRKKNHLRFHPKPFNTRRARARAEELGVVISCTSIGEMQVPPGFRLD